MADLTIDVELDGAKIPAQAKKIETEIGKIGDSSEKSAKKSRESLAKVDYSGVTKKLDSLFSSISKGTIFADFFSSAFSQITQLLSLLADKAVDLGIKSIQLAGNFQTTTNALAVFTGSARLARNELTDIEDLAQNTAGLRLESAQEGYQRLRALGFGAKQAGAFIKELGEEKILSGASDESLKKIIFNFSQIRSGGQRVSQELREMLTQMPTLQRAFYDAFGTLNPAKIQEFFDKDMDNAFKRLTDAMGKSEAASGGFNDALGKLSDEFLIAGRNFGEPFLQPVTRDIKDLTAYLRENESEWKKLGQSIADFYNGLSILTRAVDGESLGGFLLGGLEKSLDTATSGVYSQTKKLLTVVQEFGKTERLLRERADTKQFFSDFAKNNPNLLNNFAANNFTFDLSKDILTDKEASIKAFAEQQKVFQKMTTDMEKLRQDEIALLRSFYDNRMSIIDSAQKREIALVESRLTNTLQEEIEVLRKRQEIQNKYLSEQLKSVQTFYNSQLATDGLSAQETTKIKLEGYQQLRRINDEIFVSEINTQKQIAEKMRQILDERRRDLIEFKNLQIREIRQGLDAQTNEIEKAISNFGNIADYSRLIQTTSEAYGKISQITTQSFDLQLQNQSLTNEQRINLEKQKYLELQGLASEYGQKIAQIEEERHNRSIALSKERFEQAAKLYQSRQTFFANLQNSFFESGLNFGEGVPVRNILGVLGLEGGKAVLDSISNVIKGNISLYESQKTILEKNHLLATTNLQAEIDLKKDLIDLERIRLKQLFATNLLTLESSRATLLNQRDRTTDEGIKNALNLQIGGLETRITEIQKVVEATKRLESETDVDYFKRLGTIFDSQSPTIRGLIQDIKGLEESLKNLGISQAGEKQNLFQNSTEGLKKLYEQIKNGQKDFLIGQLEENQLWNNKVDLITNIRTLELGYYKDSELWALQRREKLLTAERDIWQIRQQLSEKNTFSEIEANAKVLRHINDNMKSITESVADFKIKLFDGFSNALTSPFDALERKLEKLPPIIKDVASAFLSLARDIIKAFSQKLILKLLGLDGSSSGIFGGSSSNTNGTGIFGGIFDSIKKLFNLGGRGSSSSTSSAGDSSFSGMIEQAKKLFNFGGGGGGGSIANQHEAIHSGGGKGGKLGLAGGLAIAGMGANIVGGLIGGRVGGFISGAGSGLAMGAQIGSMFGPGPGTAIGAVVGAIAGGLMSLLGGDPKRKIDKQENMPKLTQGFTDALTALRALAADKNALYNNPNEVLSKAMEIRNSIASGFSIDFQSKKYREIAKLQITSKLAEADAIIKQIQGMGDEARQALEVDKRLQTNFATGVYLRDSLSKFKHRNGMLGGAFDALDTLPSMLSRGEMVLNPTQIQAVQQNAGFDVFKNAGIPNYATGTYVAPTSFAQSSPTSASTQPIIVENKQPIVIENITLQVDSLVGVKDATEIFAKAIDTGEGQRVLVKTIDSLNARRNFTTISYKR